MMPAVILPERAIWLWPWRRHAQGHLSATRVGSRAAASWVEEEHTARSKSALKQWALFCVALALWIAFALAYIVATGLLIAAAASRLTDGRPLYVKTCLLLIIAPAILLSLVSTLMSSLAFFLSLLIWSFPALL